MKKIVPVLVFCLIFAFVSVQSAFVGEAASADSSFFYDQLDSEEKNVYNVLKTALYNKTDIPAEIQIPLKTPLVSLPQSTRPSESQANRIVNALMQDIMPHLQAALDALLADCPAIFFLDLSSESASDPSCSFGISAREEKTPDNQYVMKTTAVKMKVAIKTVYQGNTGTHINKLKQAVSDFQASGNTRYEKLSSIHTFVCQSTSYDRNFSDAKAHDAISVFESAHKSVCEGYAKAIKLLCDAADIPCILVTGYGVTSSSSAERHMWNLVQMEDGRWYGLDATWDDQESGIRTDFFLSGSSTLPSLGFYQKKFSESHIAIGDFSGTESKIFTYPTMHQTAYSPYVGITVKTLPQKLTYTTADTAVDLKGLVLKLQMANGTGPDVTSGFSADTFDFSILGTREVTVRYQGYSTQFEVTVTQAPQQSGGGNENVGTGGNETGGNGGTADDENIGNGSAENGNAGNESAGDENIDHESTDHESAADETLGGDTDKPSGDHKEPTLDDSGDEDSSQGDEDDNGNDPSDDGVEQNPEDGDGDANGSSDKAPQKEGPPFYLWAVIGVVGVGITAILVALAKRK